MKRAIFTFFASFLVGFSGAQMLPDSIEHFFQDGPGYQALPFKTVVYNYDSVGRVIEETVFFQRVPGERFTYSYVDGRLVEKQLDWYNQDGNFQWNPRTRWTTIYNMAGVDTGYIEYMYNKAGGNWDIRFSNFYALGFDVQDRIIEQVNLKMDTATNLLKNYRRTRYVYVDTDMDPDSMLSAEYINNAWEETGRASNLTWHGGFNSKSINQYPTSGHHFTKYNGSWVFDILDSAVYVGQNMTELYLYYTPVNDPDPEYMSFFYTYDARGSQIFHQEFYFMSGFNTLIGQGSDTFVYSSSGAILEHVSVSVNRTKEIFHYSKWPTGIKEHSTKEKIYPNPLSSSQRLFIQSEQNIEEVQLYSGNGAMLRKWLAPNGEGLDIQGIAPGLYFIHLLDEAGNTSTQRLIIK